jgi:hypothetical protein
LSKSWNVVVEGWWMDAMTRILTKISIAFQKLEDRLSVER